MNEVNDIYFQVILGIILPMYTLMRLIVAGIGYNMPSIPIPLRNRFFKSVVIAILGIAVGWFYALTAIIWVGAAAIVGLLNCIGLSICSSSEFYGSLFEGMTLEEMAIRKELRAKMLSK